MAWCAASSTVVPLHVLTCIGMCAGFPPVGGIHCCSLDACAKANDSQEAPRGAAEAEG